MNKNLNKQHLITLYYRGETQTFLFETEGGKISEAQLDSLAGQMGVKDGTTYSLDLPVPTRG